MARKADKPTEGRKTKEKGNGQGTVWQEGEVWRWQITLGYRDGKRKTASGRAANKSAAQAAMTQALADLARGLLAVPDSITVGEYAERWLARKRHVSERTLELYRGELAYALEHLGNVKLRDVKARHLKDLMVTLSQREMKGGRGLGKTMAPRTQGKVLTRLRDLFREAVSDQIMYVSPVDGVKKVKSPAPEAVGRVFDLHEAARFHEVGEALHAAGLCRLWPALFTAVSVGMRRGELMGLLWDCVDFEKGVLKVRRQLVQGKGGMRLKEVLKTNASRRDIHMPPSLVAALKAHRERQGFEREVMGAEWQESGAVFPTEYGKLTFPDNLGRALDSVTAWADPAKLDARLKAVRAIVKPGPLARLEAVVKSGEALPGLSPHDLRHTYATLALRSGRVPVEVVSKTLGHARVSITMDIYRHVLDSERKAHIVDLFETPLPVRKVAAPLPN